MPTAQEAAVVANLGVASARKSGRNPKYPHVPVVRHTEGGVRGDGYDEQILGRAYMTRAEAVAHAQAVINQRRSDLGGKLLNPRYRALRAQHGVDA